MPAIVAAAAIALTASAATLASAQEPPVAAYLYANTNTGDVTLSYARSDCPAECHVAGFVCTQGGSVKVFIADLQGRTIAEWFNLDAPNAQRPTAVLVIGATDVHLSFRSLTFGDLNGGWWVELAPHDHAWLGAFAGADRTVIRTPAFDIPLPNTTADRTNRAAFVQACLAM